MTIHDAINKAKDAKLGLFSQEQIIDWLNTVDGIIKREIIDTHEGGDNIEFRGYNAGTPLTAELLVPAPYDELYIRYLEMQMAYANSESDRHDRSTEAFNATYTAFERWYNRTRMPIRKRLKFF